MAEHPNDTIAAIATPPGQGGIAVVRVSGPAAGALGASLLRLSPEAFAGPRGLRLGRVHGPAGQVLDEALALWMPGPRSYTREDVLEIQCHGGHAAARAVLDRLLDGGARLAEPGEFTLRAFLNGRIDLVQAEAVADVIAARTEAALATHERLLAGDLSRRVGRWQQRLAEALALLEAHLDFAEDDVGPLELAAPLRELRAVRAEMAARLEAYPRGRVAREGFRVALVGAPNCGKSSLLNALVQDDRAIVSPEPGTTRDTIEAWVDAHGLPVHLTDTAGLRPTSDPVEDEGVERARAAAGRADLVVFVADGSRALTAEEEHEVGRLAEGGNCLPVVNKVDLGRVSADALERCFSVAPLEVSARTGAGLESLLAAWRERAWGDGGPPVEAPLTRDRHRATLARAAEAIDRAVGGLESGAFLEVAASDLHEGRRQLSALLGWGSADDVLDAVFAGFCIGK